MLSLLNRIITPPRGVTRPMRTRTRLQSLPNQLLPSIPRNIVAEIVDRQHQRYQILGRLPNPAPPRPSRRPPHPSRQPSRIYRSPVNRSASIRPPRHPNINQPRLPNSRATPNFSMTERENFDLALAIQDSLANVPTNNLPPVNVPTNNLPPVNVPNERSHTSCPICLDTIETGASGSMRSRMATCGHVFHRKCIRKWKQERLQQNRQYECPVCRFVLS